MWVDTKKKCLPFALPPTVPPPPPSSQSLADQWTIYSVNGNLNVTLVDEIDSVRIATFPGLIKARVWNKSFVAPTLRVKRGDVVTLQFINKLPEDTNLHFHGLRIPPVPPADYVLMAIQSGSNFTYSFTIPLDHPQGMFYYHSHYHGKSEEQVMNGMKGILYIEGLLDPFPALKNVTQNILALAEVRIIKLGKHHELQVPGTGALIMPNPTNRLVSGLLNPTIRVRPGETQLFSIANVGPDIYYNLSIPNSVFKVLAQDGHLQNQITLTSFFLLGPSSRVEFLWQAPIQPGIFKLLTLQMTTGSDGGDYYPEVQIGTISVQGPRVNQSLVLPSPSQFPSMFLVLLSFIFFYTFTSILTPHSRLCFPGLVDYRKSPIANTRSLTFSTSLKINGLYYNSSRIDIFAKLGTVERWVLYNSGDMFHHFHIHQGSFQLESVNGISVPLTGYQDTVLMPGLQNVTVIIPFLDPLIKGKYPFHCHILWHEDGGMMGIVQIS